QEATLNQLLIRQTGSARGFRQTRVDRGIRQNSRQRIHFDNVGDAVGIESDVDARPVTTAKHSIGTEHHPLDRRTHRLWNWRRTGKNIEWTFGTVPDPLRLEAVNRNSATWQSAEVHSDNRQHARIGAVTEHTTGELRAR